MHSLVFNENKAFFKNSSKQVDDYWDVDDYSDGVNPYVVVETLVIIFSRHFVKASGLLVV